MEKGMFFFDYVLLQGIIMQKYKWRKQGEVCDSVDLEELW